MVWLWDKEWQSCRWETSLLCHPGFCFPSFYLQTDYPQMKQTRTQHGESVLPNTKERRNFTLCCEHKTLCSFVMFSWRRPCLTKASAIPLLRPLCQRRAQMERRKTPGEFGPCLFILRHTCAISTVVKGLWIRNTNKADCGRGPGWISSLAQLSWRAILHSLLYDNHSSFLCIELCSQKEK